MKNRLPLFFSICVLLLIVSCQKAIVNPTTVSTNTILSTEANIVLFPTYDKFSNDAFLFYQGTITFQSDPSQQNLINCRQLWLNTNNDYEQSAASLFGAGGSLGADPASLINTYPIDTAGIKAIINSPAVLTQNYIDSLPSTLVGLRGIEYELYGINGNKTASEFTPHQLSYITAVALSTQLQLAQVDSAWNPSISGNFNSDFVNAGNGSAIYNDQRAAFSDLIMAIANICETDGIYKLNGPLANNNIYLQESPYANTSIQNIKNNIIGVQNIYLGQYGNQTGTGLTTLVSKFEPALDLQIKKDMSNIIKSLNAITMPLSQAILAQPAQIHIAMNMCDSLDDILKNDLQNFVFKHTN